MGTLMSQDNPTYLKARCPLVALSEGSTEVCLGAAHWEIWDGTYGSYCSPRGLLWMGYVI